MSYKSETRYAPQRLRAVAWFAGGVAFLVSLDPAVAFVPALLAFLFGAAALTAPAAVRAER